MKLSLGMHVIQLVTPISGQEWRMKISCQLHSSQYNAKYCVSYWVRKVLMIVIALPVVIDSGMDDQKDAWSESEMWRSTIVQISNNQSSGKFPSALRACPCTKLYVNHIKISTKTLCVSWVFHWLDSTPSTEVPAQTLRYLVLWHALVKNYSNFKGEESLLDSQRRGS